MSAPLVALTATTRDIEGIIRVRLNEAYVRAVRAAGLTPLVLPPLPPEALEPVLAAVRGVVLTGGEDVDPAEYGAASLGSNPPHVERDKCELALVRLARDRNIPTLAICRGIQVANVALGGTLVQDIPTEIPSKINHDQADCRAMRVHDVFIEPGSKLAAALGATKVEVNSSHHQSIARVAEGLRVTGTALDGVIEAAEWQGDYWWMLGVQWHPEELISDAPDWDRGLFRAFARQVMALDQPLLAHD